MKYESNQLSKSNYQFMEIQRFIKAKEYVQLKPQRYSLQWETQQNKNCSLQEKKGNKKKEKLRLKSLI